MPRKLALFLLMTLLFTSCHRNSVDRSMHLVLRENPQSLDPGMSQDAIACYAIGSVYEPLLQYHYLKRPYEVTTLLAEEMPKYSADGRTVTIKIKKGVRFQNDPCFLEGQGRELEAEDFIFAFKRLADPKNKSEGVWVFDKRVVGFSEWRAEAIKSGAADYSKPITGFKALDKYTLQIKLIKKYPQLNYILTTYYTAPIPHEAIEKYGVEINRHPVGTGPFKLKEFVSGSHLAYVKNENFHGETFPELQAKPKNEAVPKTLQYDYGRALPMVDQLTVHIMIERGPMWLKFLKGQLDHAEIPKDNFSASIEAAETGKAGGLKPELQKKGMVLSVDQSSTEWWIGFNMTDPILGKNKLLRKAMALAFDAQKHNELFGFGISLLSNQILPATVNGYIPNFPPKEYNIAKAKALLAQAGYPGGKGLPTFNYDTEGAVLHRQMGEFFKTQMAQIGINIKVNLHTRPEYYDVRKKGKTQIIYDGWIADYPDAENFMQLLYGPNSSPGMNNSSYKNAEYDSLYEKMRDMAPSPERQKIIERMTSMAMEDQVWIPNWVAKILNVRQPWLKNYLYSDFGYNVYKYYRVDFEEKERALKTN